MASGTARATPALLAVRILQRPSGNKPPSNRQRGIHSTTLKKIGWPLFRSTRTPTHRHTKAHPSDHSNVRCLGVMYSANSFSSSTDTASKNSIVHGSVRHLRSRQAATRLLHSPGFASDEAAPSCLASVAAACSVFSFTKMSLTARCQQAHGRHATAQHR